MVMESIFIKTGIFILEILAILYLMATESFNIKMEHIIKEL